MNLDDTIVAIATPPGRGGIGVVRLAGPGACEIALPMLRLKHALEPGRAVFGELIDPGNFSGDVEGSADAGTTPLPNSRMDEVVVTYFARPRSYTTDDIIEISAHGSPVVLGRIVELALAAGARLAEPGEFTMRAFLNGRLDLTQAEAVRDLIDAQTVYQAKVAAQQLEGALSRRIQPIKQKLIELIALLEAGIDFAEDDVAVLPESEISRQLSLIEAPLEQLARSFAYGKMVHEGLTLAIVGRPNVGKSSLFNRLIERERAIVTSTPGTTRDLVSETVSLQGIPIKLVDTAGIRQALDEAESIGIQKSLEALADADLVLIVLDGSQAVVAQDEELLRQAAQRAAILVRNKADLNGTCAAPIDSPLPQVKTSAVTGEGISELRREILRHVSGEKGMQVDPGFLTNVRQQRLVQDAISGLQKGRTAARSETPHEMVLLDLYSALRALDEITGATTTDDILNLIFSTFCIGK